MVSGAAWDTRPLAFLRGTWCPGVSHARRPKAQRGVPDISLTLATVAKYIRIVMDYSCVVLEESESPHANPSFELDR